MNYATELEWHKDLLVLLAKRMKPKCYLELGCRTDPAFLYLAQYCQTIVGVDKDSADYQPPPNAHVYRMTTDQFFLGPGLSIPPPELVLIDACHEKTQVNKDFDGVASIAAPNCIVVLHDTFPENDGYVDPNYCHDSYRVPPMLLEAGWETVTLPFPPGVTICRLRPTSLLSAELLR